MTASPGAGHAGPLENFPSYLLRKGISLYRAHPVGIVPIWYSSSEHGYLNLPKPFGTLHLASDLTTAVSELLSPAAGRFRSVTVRQTREFQVSKLNVTRSIRLANISHDRVSEFGFKPFVLSSPDTPDRTRQWASALQRAGFGGISYRCRFDTGAKNTGVALFGGSGLPARTDVEVDPEGMITGPLAAAEAGFHIVPHQTRIHLDIIK